MEKVMTKKKHGGNNSQNLIPLNKLSVTRQREIQSMGGKACKNNPNASLGQKLRFLREKGFTDKTKERLFELMKNTSFSHMDMLNYLEEVRKEKGLNAETKLKVLSAIKDISKLIHGTRENDSRHATVVVHLTVEEKEKEILRLLKD